MAAREELSRADIVKRLMEVVVKSTEDIAASPKKPNKPVGKKVKG